jgi:carboxymethylenebutenolidase
MCDQDHFDKDREGHESLGLVITRRQFGVLVGAGITMMLPEVANAVAVTEQEVNIKTPDGTADAYFVHPSTGTAPGVLVWPDIFGLRPAFRQMAKRLAETGYSVVVVNPFYRVQKAPTAAQGSATPNSAADAAGAGAERDHADDRCESVHRLARSATVGGQEPQGRYAGLLHGRADRLPHCGLRCPVASVRSRHSTVAAL